MMRELTKGLHTQRFTAIIKNEIGSHLMKVCVALSVISYKFTEYFGKVHTRCSSSFQVFSNLFLRIPVIGGKKV